MLPPFSVAQDEFEVGAFQAECEFCGVQSLHPAVANYTYVAYLGIFGFVRRLEVFGTCSKCEQPIFVPEALVPEHVREHIPALRRKGCAGLLLVGIVVGVLLFLRNFF